MEKFSTLISTAVPLDISNVDTDQIIPARFLKATDKKGFGDNLFRDWRYNKQGDLIEDLHLTNPNTLAVSSLQEIILVVVLVVNTLLGRLQDMD